MSYASLLRHTVAIERPELVLVGGQPQADEYGHALQAYAEIATIMALVQPKGGREVPTVTDAGVVVADFEIFFPAGTDVREADRVIHDGRPYEVKLVRDAGGRGHHIEVDALLIRSDPTPSGPESS